MMRVLLLCLLAMGCGRSAQPTYHALPTPPPPEAASTDLAVVVGPVRIPSFLSRPYVAWREGPSELAFDEYHRWGSNLENEISRATGEHLSQLLGTLRVVTHPAQDPSDRAIQVSIDIEQLDVSEDLSRMRARFVLRRGKARKAIAVDLVDVRAELSRERASSAVVTYAALVEALAKKIAERIKGL